MLHPLCDALADIVSAGMRSRQGCISVHLFCGLVLRLATWQPSARPCSLDLTLRRQPAAPRPHPHRRSWLVQLQLQQQ